MPSQAVLELLVRMKDEASKGLASLGDAVGSLGMVAGGIAAAGVLALGAAVVGGIGDAREAARLYASTEQTILTMGNAAGRSTDQVVDLASSLSDAAGASLFGDDQVQQASNLLLTFGEIKGETFDLATALTVDLAQALGGAPADQAMMLGKALNDPTKGLTALGKAGLTFSEEQKAVIAALQESGDMAGAQAIIIAELNKQVGGQAQAAADASGGWSEFQGRLGEAAETVGGALLPIIAQLGGFLLDVIVPAVEGAAVVFGDLVNYFTAVAEDGDTLNDFLGNLPGFIQPIVLGIGELAVWLGETLPGVIATILPLFSGEMPEALGATGETFTLLGETVQAIMALISGIIAVAIPAMIKFWEDHGEQITRIVKASFDFVVSVINAALTLIKGIITVALDVINGDWEAAWAHFQELVAGFAMAIGDVIKKFLDLIASYFNTSLDEIAQIWTDNWNQLVDIVQNISWEDVGRFAIQGIRAGLEAFFPGLINWVSDKVGSMVEAALDAIGASSPATKFMPVGQFAVMGIIQGFADAWPGLQAAIGDMGDKMIEQAQGIAQAAQRALGAAFGAEASIDRQVAANLDKLKDVLPQYLAYTQGALAQVQREAEAMQDPAQGARWFKMRSDQILEYAALQKDLADEIANAAAAQKAMDEARMYRDPEGAAKAARAAAAAAEALAAIPIAQAKAAASAAADALAAQALALDPSNLSLQAKALQAHATALRDAANATEALAKARDTAALAAEAAADAAKIGDPAAIAEAVAAQAEANAAVERLKAQMLLINQAQTAEIAAYQALQAGQAAPIAAMADEIKKMMDALTEQLMAVKEGEPNQAALATLAQLAALYDMLNNAPGRATGGLVSANEPYWVGERGRELFVPSQAGAIVPSGGGAGMGMALTFNISGGDPEQIANRVIAKIEQRMKGRR